MRTLPSLSRSCIHMASCLVLASATAAFADSSITTARSTSMLAEGVYEIRHPDAPDGFPQSNTTVIIGDHGVLVVDTCLLPSTARQDIEQIRKWTSRPVTFIVNTHWHFDHTLGNAEYAAAFPGAQFIAHIQTQKIIANFNPGAIERYPSRAQRFQAILDSGKDPDGKPLSEADRKDYQKAMAGLAPVVAEFENARQLVPNVSFDSLLNIDLGARRVEIKFLGRGNTSGDTVVYLPAEKILCTGDLLDHPVPYFFGGFTNEQAATLMRMAELDAHIFIPGHGDVLRDKQYIELTIELLNTVNASIEKAINGGKTLQETEELVPKEVDEPNWRRRFTGDQKEDGDAFDQTFQSLVKNSYNLIKAR